MDNKYARCRWAPHYGPGVGPDCDCEGCENERIADIQFTGVALQTDLYDYLVRDEIASADTGDEDDVPF